MCVSCIRVNSATARGLRYARISCVSLGVPAKPYKNERVAALLRGALDQTEMTIEELGVTTKLGRGPAGALVRGEVRRIAPEQANELARRLPVTVAQILEAYGYDLSVTKQQRVPRELAESWADLPDSIRSGVLQIVQAAARLHQAEGERAS